MSFARFLGFSLAVLSVSAACSPSRGTTDAPDASTPNTALAMSADARAVHARVAAMPAFTRIARAKVPGATASSFEAATRVGANVVFPRRASAPVHISTEGNAWLDLAADVSASDAEPVEGSLVFRDVAPATDVLLAALDEGVEELRVLRGPEAPSTLSWNVRTAAGHRLRVREGIAELVDTNGRVVLAAARPFAIDAQGTRRELDFSLAGEILTARLQPQGLAYPIVVDPLWSTIAPFIVANRVNYTVTKLASGKVLVGAGQPSGGGPISSAEVYDPATNTWASAGNMAYPRMGGFSALLTAGASAGKVFVAGGSIPGSEVYDPATGTSVGGPAPGVTVTTLAGAGSRVLIYNGSSSLSWNSATNTWGATANAATNRYLGTSNLWTMTSLPDGRVVILGGHAVGPTSTTAVDIYRPSTNDFVTGTASSVAVENHAATLFASGTKILVSGGTSVGTKASTVSPYGAVYDIAANSWANYSMISGRTGHGASLLPNGKIVIAGGGTTGVELFNPATNAFEVAGNAPATDLGTNTVPISTGGLFFPTRYLFAPGALGTKCIVGYECNSGNCVQGTCCSSSSCGTGQRCDTATKAGTCIKPNGITCGAGTECESGLCIDGVCCNSACGSQCQACDVPGKLGTCAPVYGAPHGTKRAACAGAGAADVCQQQICNGTDVAACHFAPAFTVVCGANTCAAGKESHTGTCDGAGKCSDVPRVCGVYTCGATNCKTSCTANTDCVAGFYCDTTKSACVPMIGLGNKCSSALPCNSGLFCTDGACCGVADCGAGSTCGAAGKEGTCVGKQGSSCKVDAECGTSSCADGGCCDTACTGQCEACDVAGSVGTCTPVTGSPHGTRTACPVDATNECASPTCDGADRARCAAFPGSEKECRKPSCKGGLLTSQALCDGKGGCPAKTTSSCGGYRCDEAANVCRTSCSTAADCATGYSCDAGSCKKNTSFCSLDGLSIVDNVGVETPCKPYRCKDARCQASCETSDDCTGGTLCATDSKTCVQPSPPAVEEDSGGSCALSTSTRSHTAEGVLALLALALLGRSRARARG